MKYFSILFVFCVLAQSVLANRSENIAKVSVEPKTVLIEKTATLQNASFDFRVENTGAETIRIARIELSVFDRQGALQLRKFITAAGLRHGDYEIAAIAPKTFVFIFNPFEDFSNEIALDRMRYEFFFEPEKGGKQFSFSTEISPQVFVPKTKLTLPLKGRILVHDGHDTHAHHRRFNLAHPFLKEIGVTRNFTRYASDLCIVNEKGDLRRNASEANTDWYGFGAVVYAPGNGKIARIRNDVADNINGKSTSTLEEFRREPATPAGNFIMIDHQNGEFSLLAHLKHASVQVKEGDFVKAGQPIAQMGVSGDAYLPHIHYELRSAATVDADAFPAYFRTFVRLLGSRRIPIAQSPVNSGDILENR